MRAGAACGLALRQPQRTVCRIGLRRAQPGSMRGRNRRLERTGQPAAQRNRQRLIKIKRIDHAADRFAGLGNEAIGKRMRAMREHGRRARGVSRLVGGAGPDHETGAIGRAGAGDQRLGERIARRAAVERLLRVGQRAQPEPGTAGLVARRKAI
ncbi:MAG: hypothetical protein GAK41_00881 [Burkholderia gladioli]|nr:MAG: hypothetical protein GAK41_00881 [Burkholderia gladioli]